MAEVFEGRVEELAQTYSNTPQPVSLQHLGALRVSDATPRYYEWARKGWLFGFNHTIATAITPVQVFPTTTGNLVLNNADTTGCCVVPLLVSVMNGSGTNGIGFSLLAGVTPSALATQLVADGSGVVHKNLRDNANTPTAYADFNKTVVAPVYNVIASSAMAAAAVPGGGVTADCMGMFVIKPTFAFVLDVLSGAGTSAKFNVNVIYARVPTLTP